MYLPSLANPQIYDYFVPECSTVSRFKENLKYKLPDSETTPNLHPD